MPAAARVVKAEDVDAQLLGELFEPGAVGRPDVLVFVEAVDYGEPRLERGVVRVHVAHKDGGYGVRHCYRPVVAHSLVGDPKHLFDVPVCCAFHRWPVVVAVVFTHIVCAVLACCLYSRRD